MLVICICSFIFLVVLYIEKCGIFLLLQQTEICIDSVRKLSLMNLFKIVRHIAQMSVLLINVIQNNLKYIFILENGY